jgi:hypothetical protein
VASGSTSRSRSSRALDGEPFAFEGSTTGSGR